MTSPPSLAWHRTDFITGDVEALATHMQHCALAKGRWFALASRLQRVWTVAAGRLVTVACVAAVLVIGLSAVV